MSDDLRADADEIVRAREAAQTSIDLYAKAGTRRALLDAATDELVDAMADLSDRQVVWLCDTAKSVERMREALEFAAQMCSSDWPERCQEIVRRARAALDAGPTHAD